MASHLQDMMSTSNPFGAFFKGWLERQQAFLDQLLDTPNHEAKNSSLLIELALSHYADYYEKKAQLVWQDVFLIFSPPWLSSLEKSLLWMGGFKPSITFSLVEFSVSDMVPEQVEKLIRLKKETKIEERTLMDALAAVQEAMGSPPLINLVKQYGRLVNGEVSDFAEAIDEMKHSLSSLVHSADNLRRNTVMKVIQILNENQSLKFLSAVAKYQLSSRAKGLQNDVQNEREGAYAPPLL